MHTIEGEIVGGEEARGGIKEFNASAKGFIAEARSEIASLPDDRRKRVCPGRRQIRDERANWATITDDEVRRQIEEIRVTRAARIDVVDGRRHAHQRKQRVAAIQPRIDCAATGDATVERPERANEKEPFGKRRLLGRQQAGRIEQHQARNRGVRARLGAVGKTELEEFSNATGHEARDGRADGLTGPALVRCHTPRGLDEAAIGDDGVLQKAAAHDAFEVDNVGEGLGTAVGSILQCHVEDAVQGTGPEVQRGVGEHFRRRESGRAHIEDAIASVEATPCERGDIGRRAECEQHLFRDLDCFESARRGALGALGETFGEHGDRRQVAAPRQTRNAPEILRKGSFATLRAELNFRSVNDRLASKILTAGRKTRPPAATGKERPGVRAHGGDTGADADLLERCDHARIAVCDDSLHFLREETGDGIDAGNRFLRRQIAVAGLRLVHGTRAVGIGANGSNRAGGAFARGRGGSCFGTFAAADRGLFRVTKIGTVVAIAVTVISASVIISVIESGRRGQLRRGLDQIVHGAIGVDPRKVEPGPDPETSGSTRRRRRVDAAILDTEDERAARRLLCLPDRAANADDCERGIHAIAGAIAIGNPPRRCAKAALAQGQCLAASARRALVELVVINREFGRRAQRHEPAIRESDLHAPALTGSQRVAFEDGVLAAQAANRSIDAYRLDDPERADDPADRVLRGLRPRTGAEHAEKQTKRKNKEVDTPALSGMRRNTNIRHQLRFPDSPLWPARPAVRTYRTFRRQTARWRRKRTMSVQRRYAHMRGMGTASRLETVLQWRQRQGRAGRMPASASGLRPAASASMRARSGRPSAGSLIARRMRTVRTRSSAAVDGLPSPRPPARRITARARETPWRWRGVRCRGDRKRPPNRYRRPARKLRSLQPSRCRQSRLRRARARLK